MLGGHVFLYHSIGIPSCFFIPLYLLLFLFLFIIFWPFLNISPILFTCSFLFFWFFLVQVTEWFTIPLRGGVALRRRRCDSTGLVLSGPLMFSFFYFPSICTFILFFGFFGTFLVCRISNCYFSFVSDIVSERWYVWYLMWRLLSICSTFFAFSFPSFCSFALFLCCFLFGFSVFLSFFLLYVTFRLFLSGIRVMYGAVWCSWEGAVSGAMVKW